MHNICDEKDIELLIAIGRVGFITEQLYPYLKISSQRIDANIKNGYIISKGYYLLYGASTKIYTLTEQGKDFLRDELFINPYKHKAAQLEHDFCLAKVYLSLPLDVRNSWLTETQLKLQYGEDVNSSDGLFISNSKKIAVEIISDSYTKERIELKKQFIKEYCDDFIMFHTHKELEYIL